MLWPAHALASAKAFVQSLAELPMDTMDDEQALAATKRLTGELEADMASSAHLRAMLDDDAPQSI